MTNSKKNEVNKLVTSGNPNRNNGNKSVTNARTVFPKLEAQKQPSNNNNNKPANNKPTNNKPTNNQASINNNNRPANNQAANNNNNRPANNNNNRPVNNNRPANNKGLVEKLREIYLESTDLVSNVIKITTVLIVILAIFLAVNLALALSGHIQLAILYLIIAIVVFISGELVLPGLLKDSTPGGNNMLLNVISTILFGTGTILLCMCVKKAYDYFSSQKTEAPMILKGNKSARSSMVIPQNPEDPETVILYRSDNEDEGIEFTYTYWMLIDNYEYKTNEWKHILHKGNKEGSPNMCPGFWLHPNKNSMRVYFNTMKNMKEYFDIDNMPLKKWICVSLTVKQRVVECFINGMLKKRHSLSSIPRQNFGELWINLFGGFDGYISKVQYFRRALSYEEVAKLVKNGPSGSSCIDTGELPPYLDDDWWLNSL